MKYFVDINCDLGEGFGNYKVSNEDEIMPLISSCNVACGFHAGDPSVIAKTIEVALQHDVKVGAHPSFPDLQGFGRRVMHMDSRELHDSILYQVSAVKGMTETLGGQLHHVKPHGALYNHSSAHKEVARSVYQAIYKIDPTLKVYGLPKSVHEEIALEIGLTFVAEGFGDRKYTNKGSLLSRSIDGSVLTEPDQVSDQIKKIVLDKKVDTYEGYQIGLEVNTVCIHGDNPESLQILRHLKESLTKVGITIA